MMKKKKSLRFWRKRESESSHMESTDKGVDLSERWPISGFCFERSRKNLPKATWHDFWHVGDDGFRMAGEQFLCVLDDFSVGETFEGKTLTTIDYLSSGHTEGPDIGGRGEGILRKRALFRASGDGTYRNDALRSTVS